MGGEGELGFELLVEAHKLLDGVGRDEIKMFPTTWLS